MKRSTPLRRGRRKPRPSLTGFWHEVTDRPLGRIPATDTETGRHRVNGPPPAQEVSAPMQDRPYSRGVSKAAKPKTCECGATFTPYNSTHRYCSSKCSAREIVRDCLECGEPFKVDRSYAARPERGLYCSMKCKNRSGRLALDPVYCRCGAKIGHKRVVSKRKTCGDPVCTSSAKAESKTGSRNPNYLGDEAAKIRWRTQAGECCVVCGSTYRLQLHHVVYAQHVRNAHGDPWDPADSLMLCNGCHCRHHANPRWKLPVSYLRDENYAFLRDLLGLAAYDYLGRYYHDDGDERMYELLEEEAA